MKNKVNGLAFIVCTIASVIAGIYLNTFFMYLNGILAVLNGVVFFVTNFQNKQKEED